MNKILISVVVRALLISGIGWFSYKAGVNSEIAKGAKIISEYQEKQRKIVKELEQAKQNREVIYRDKIKIIKEAADPTSCLTTDAPNSVLQQLPASGPSR